MNEGIFFNKYERKPIQLIDANYGQNYGLVHDPEPKVRYIINKYESNPAAADIDDDESDGNAPNVQYVIEQPVEASYMEVRRHFDSDATPKQFDTSVTFIEMGAAGSPDKIVLIPDPKDPTRSTEGHTLHELKAEKPNTTFPIIRTPKKGGGSKKRTKGSRKSKSKTRVKRGRAKSKKRG
jgi:hypothetical protein